MYLLFLLTFSQLVSWQNNWVVATLSFHLTVFFRTCERGRRLVVVVKPTGCTCSTQGAFLLLLFLRILFQSLSTIKSEYACGILVWVMRLWSVLNCYFLRNVFSLVTWISSVKQVVNSQNIVEPYFHWIIVQVHFLLYILLCGDQPKCFLSLDLVILFPLLMTALDRPGYISWRVEMKYLPLLRYF